MATFDGSADEIYMSLTEPDGNGSVVFPIKFLNNTYDTYLWARIMIDNSGDIGYDTGSSIYWVGASINDVVNHECLFVISREGPETKLILVDVDDDIYYDTYGANAWNLDLATLHPYIECEIPWVAVLDTPLTSAQAHTLAMSGDLLDTYGDNVRQLADQTNVSASADARSIIRASSAYSGTVSGATNSSNFLPYITGTIKTREFSSSPLVISLPNSSTVRFDLSSVVDKYKYDSCDLGSNDGFNFFTLGAEGAKGATKSAGTHSLSIAAPTGFVGTLYIELTLTADTAYGTYADTYLFQKDGTTPASAEVAVKLNVWDFTGKLLYDGYGSIDGTGYLTEEGNQYMDDEYYIPELTIAAFKKGATKEDDLSFYGRIDTIPVP